MTTPQERLMELASDQYGVITLKQLLALGFSRKEAATRIRKGHLVEAYRGTYLIAGSPESFEQRAKAATLAAGAGAVLFRLGAGALHGIPNVPRWPEVLLPPGRQVRVPNLTVVRTRCLPREDTVNLRGIPATAGPRTLIDLAGRYGKDKVRPMVDHGLIHRLVTRRVLYERACALQDHRMAGAALILELLEDFPVTKRPIGSEQELALFRLLEAAGFELPEPQYRILINGEPRYIDFAWPGRKLALEVDSYLWHGSRRAFERDRARTAELVALGWRVLPITWGDVYHDPAGVLRKIAGALAA